MLSVFFLLLLLLVSGLGRTGKNRVRMFRRLLPRTRLISTGIVSLDTLEQNLRRTCLVSLKVFCVRVWHALCFTEKGNGGNERICGILLFNHQKHLHLHDTSGHETWQFGNLHWGAASHKVSWPCNHAILQNHLTN